MSVSAIQPANATLLVSATQPDAATVASSASGMNGNEFMLILLAQLKNQNPLEPMDNSEFMGQMTQLNSLQELQRINGSLEYLITIIGENGGVTA